MSKRHGVVSRKPYLCLSHRGAVCAICGTTVHHPNYVYGLWLRGRVHGAKLAEAYPTPRPLGPTRRGDVCWNCGREGPGGDVETQRHPTLLHGMVSLSCRKIVLTPFLHILAPACYRSIDARLPRSKPWERGVSSLLAARLTSEAQAEMCGDILEACQVRLRFFQHMGLVWYRSELLHQGFLSGIVGRV